ncbi:cell division protein FtsL [Sedimentimonas flavescens]|uniref:Cell division protein FtsL n=2 Tax=Rhodobacter group TaxID=3374108 RepID=A0ABT2ZWT5_9RHOB|nr:MULTISPECIES: cell division protein FtsL [Paracoccaceae]WBL33965.1 cell division protein FtsL [Sinirhodobacter sp. HNIBRBA609]MBW0158808.1 cell division protein FtsL [Sedimentimonas flavescens]MCE5974617.1 cell division protein FtsL [Sinirhodobacter sp. WL0062]MCT2540184.1 cell division protein FtsL [Sedimentimonas flavescens]MCV2878213.1 cell division protein FtsL [Sedimentimonas flavescens]
MRNFIYLATALSVMGLAFWAYRVNYETQDLQGELRALNREIASLHEGLSVLRAEWAYLNRPDRLRELVDLNFERLQLLPLSPEQFGSVAQVAYPLPPEEPVSEPIDVIASTQALEAAE